MEKESASVLNYVLGIKKVGVANCETISQALPLEKELEKWIESLEENENE